MVDKVIGDAFTSIQYIMSDNMSTKMIRENVIMPIHLVKEVNSYSLSWLSRKPGLSIKDKIARANNTMMAVQRRESLDTLENRLLMEFIRVLVEYLYIKFDSIRTDKIREIMISEGDYNELGDNDILVLLSRYISLPDYAEIRKWTNLPPNNTLLSNPHYSKIWKAWSELQRVDNIIEDISQALPNYIANIFILQFLAYMKQEKSIQIPQEPIYRNYEYDEIGSKSLSFQVLYNKNQHIKIYKSVVDSRNDFACVIIKSNQKTLYIHFYQKTIEIKCMDDRVYFSELTVEGILGALMYCEKYFGFVFLQKSYLKPLETKSAIVDIFALYPKILVEGEYLSLTKRMLQQSYSIINSDGEKETYHIACDNSTAIKMLDEKIKTFSMLDSIRMNNFEETKRLIALFDKEVTSEICHFVIPDIYDELTLSSTFNRSVNIRYGLIQDGKWSKLPESIAVAFALQVNARYTSFDDKDEVIVVVDIAENKLVITILESGYNEKLDHALPYKGILWERHPRKVYSIQEKVEKVIHILEDRGCKNAQELYDILGLKNLIEESENGHLSLHFGDEDWFTLSETTGDLIRTIRIPIDEYIGRLFIESKINVKNRNIRIISLASELEYSGNISYQSMSREEVLRGVGEYQETIKKLEDRGLKIPLWRDYLEPLAIKRLIGQFDLLKESKVVEPILGIKIDLPISDTFTLHKDIQKHEFMLIRGNGAGKLNYSAVINLDRPLEHDVTCELQLTYEYGAENPYELIFIPIAEADRNAYKRFKVEWIPTDYSESNIQVDLSVVPKRWDELQMYASTRGFNVDVCDVISEEYFLPLVWEPFVCKFTNRTQIKNWCSDPKADLRDRFFNKYKELDRYKNNTPVDMGKLQHVISKEKFYKGATFIVLLGIDSDMAENPNRSIVVSDFTVTKFDCDELCMNAEIDRLKREKNNKKYFNPYYTKWLFALFLGNRIIDTEAPKRLKQIFEQVKANWAVMYNNAGTKAQRRKLIRLISLAGKQIGEQYFIAVHKYLDTYKQDDYCTNQIPFKCISEIGCGLSDLSTIEEQQLLTRIHEEVEALDVVGVLAKAIWHNQDFLAGICSNQYSINFENLINTYMAEAIDYIHECVETKAYHNGDDIELDESNDIEINSAMVKNRMIICFEFILGVLRLKLKGDGSINMVLSFENEMLEKLTKDIETLYKQGFVVNTYLDVGEVDKGEYQDLDPILFLILVLILGYDIKSDIHIGYNVENIQTEQE